MRKTRICHDGTLPTNICSHYHSIIPTYFPLRYAEKQLTVSAEHNQKVVKVRNDQRVMDLEENKNEIREAKEKLATEAEGEVVVCVDAFSNGVYGMPM